MVNCRNRPRKRSQKRSPDTLNPSGWRWPTFGAMRLTWPIGLDNRGTTKALRDLMTFTPALPPTSGISDHAAEFPGNLSSQHCLFGCCFLLFVFLRFPQSLLLRPGTPKLVCSNTSQRFRGLAGDVPTCILQPTCMIHEGSQQDRSTNPVQATVRAALRALSISRPHSLPCAAGPLFALLLRRGDP